MPMVLLVALTKSISQTKGREISNQMTLDYLEEQIRQRREEAEQEFQEAMEEVEEALEVVDEEERIRGAVILDVDEAVGDL